MHVNGSQMSRKNDFVASMGCKENQQTVHMNRKGNIQNEKFI